MVKTPVLSTEKPEILLKRFEKDCLRQIDQLSGMILEQLSDTKRTTLNSLIINRVHCRDVI